MKRTLLLGVLLVASASPGFGWNADDPIMAYLGGELDPALEFEHANPPSFNDCLRLGWTRGVHVEIDGELNAWMAVCLKGEVPFVLDDEHFKRNRALYLKSKKGTPTPRRND